MKTPVVKTLHTRAIAAALMLALTTGATLGVWSAASAADAKSLIETRRANFKKMGKAMKSIVEQSKAEAPDKAVMLAGAQVIGSYAADIASWFPAGSGSEAGVETEALPYLWQAHDKFDAIAAKLGPEEKKLEAALAGDDLAAIRAQVKAMGGVCGECHKSFRKE